LALLVCEAQVLLSRRRPCHLHPYLWPVLPRVVFYIRRVIDGEASGIAIVGPEYLARRVVGEAMKVELLAGV
jgi:hypothetical protein